LLDSLEEIGCSRDARTSLPNVPALTIKTILHKLYYQFGSELHERGESGELEKR
jgi:hypothetical protein